MGKGPGCCTHRLGPAGARVLSSVRSSGHWSSRWVGRHEVGSDKGIKGLGQGRLLRPRSQPALPLQEALGRVAESGLPALLLQCLYLFFVFPLEEDEHSEDDVQVQRMFVQVSESPAEPLWAGPSSASGSRSHLLCSRPSSLLRPTICKRERPRHRRTDFALVPLYPSLLPLFFPRNVSAFSAWPTRSFSSPRSWPCRSSPASGTFCRWPPPLREALANCTASLTSQRFLSSCHAPCAVVSCLSPPPSQDVCSAVLLALYKHRKRALRGGWGLGRDSGSPVHSQWALHHPRCRLPLLPEAISGH